MYLLCSALYKKKLLKFYGELLKGSRQEYLISTIWKNLKMWLHFYQDSDLDKVRVKRCCYLEEFFDKRRHCNTDWITRSAPAPCDVVLANIHNTAPVLSRFHVDDSSLFSRLKSWTHVVVCGNTNVFLDAFIKQLLKAAISYVMFVDLSASKNHNLRKTGFREIWSLRFLLNVWTRYDFN